MSLAYLCTCPLFIPSGTFPGPCHPSLQPEFPGAALCLRPPEAQRHIIVHKWRNFSEIFLYHQPPSLQGPGPSRKQRSPARPSLPVFLGKGATIRGEAVTRMSTSRTLPACQDTMPNITTTREEETTIPPTQMWKLRLRRQKSGLHSCCRTGGVPFEGATSPHALQIIPNARPELFAQRLCWWDTCILSDKVFAYRVGGRS